MPDEILTQLASLTGKPATTATLAPVLSRVVDQLVAAPNEPQARSPLSPDLFDGRLPRGSALAGPDTASGSGRSRS